MAYISPFGRRSSQPTLFWYRRPCFWLEIQWGYSRPSVSHTKAVKRSEAPQWKSVLKVVIHAIQGKKYLLLFLTKKLGNAFNDKKYLLPLTLTNKSKAITKMRTIDINTKQSYVIVLYKPGVIVRHFMRIPGIYLTNIFYLVEHFSPV